ncbi:MAG: response regulator transcription factor [Firmicutes bacterium]|nr:response regulator transcription factor [Bacillota bacterium]
MMIGVIFRSVRKKTVDSPKHAALLLVVVLLNIIFWLIEQLVQWDFEFLSVSYILSELLLLLLYSMLQDYEELQKQAAAQIQPAKTETPEKSEEIKEPEKAESLKIQQTDFLEQKAAYWAKAAQLSPREKDVFKELLTDKKRKEIALALFISENTVKTHTSNIFSKLEVSTRNELIEKVLEKEKE